MYSGMAGTDLRTTVQKSKCGKAVPERFNILEGKGSS